MSDAGDFLAFIIKIAFYLMKHSLASQMQFIHSNASLRATT